MSLQEKSQSLQEQEQSKASFLEKVSKKDKEIAQLNSLLQQSLKEVSVEGIMTASQLDSKTSKLQKQFQEKRPLNTTQERALSSKRNTADGSKLSLLSSSEL